MPEIKLDIRNNKNMLMALCLVLTAVTFLVGRLVTPIALSLGLNDMLVRTVTRAVCAVVCIVALGGCVPTSRRFATHGATLCPSS